MFIEGITQEFEKQAQSGPAIVADINQQKQERLKQQLGGVAQNVGGRVASGLKHGAGEAALFGLLPGAFAAKGALVAKHLADQPGGVRKAVDTAFGKAPQILKPFIGETKSYLLRTAEQIAGKSTPSALLHGFKQPYKIGFLKPKHSLIAAGLLAMPGFAKGFITAPNKNEQH